MNELGGQLPEHRNGHCGFDPGLTGAICNAPADTHLLTTKDGVPWSLFACPEHRDYAKAAYGIDWHDVADVCLKPGVEWQFGEKRGEGFCVDPDDDALARLTAELRALEPAT